MEENVMKTYNEFYRFDSKEVDTYPHLIDGKYGTFIIFKLEGENNYRIEFLNFVGEIIDYAGSDYLQRGYNEDFINGWIYAKDFV
jgi:hypothetical protein